jgi:hypothetical protein
MSFILKMAYQHKHKKYRYYRDKPINFNQIRQQLGIHLPSHALQYLVEDSQEPPCLQA